MMIREGDKGGRKVIAINKEYSKTKHEGTVKHDMCKTSRHSNTKRQSKSREQAEHET